MVPVVGFMERPTGRLAAVPEAVRGSERHWPCQVGVAERLVEDQFAPPGDGHGLAADVCIGVPVGEPMPQVLDCPVERTPVSRHCASLWSGWVEFLALVTAFRRLASPGPVRELRTKSEGHRSNVANLTANAEPRGT